MNKPKPKAHDFTDGGGLVSGCDNIHIARSLMALHMVIDVGLLPEDYEWVNDEPKIRRGRIVPVAPNQDYAEEYSWLWKTLPDDAKGSGVTTAVVWNV